VFIKNWACADIVFLPLLVYNLIMRKAIALVILLFTAAAAFGQEFDFQGLKWGATREQVIEKLGQPDVRNTNDTVMYAISDNGYLSLFSIYFENNKMIEILNHVGRFQRLNTAQLKLAFLTSISQLTELYGTYHEIYTNLLDNNEEQFYVWHLNNFHIIINTITDNSNRLEIYYCSTLEWNKFETNLNKQRMIRFPNIKN